MRARVGRFLHALVVLLDAKLVAAVLGLGLLGWGIQGKWDGYVAGMVLGALLLLAVLWAPLLQIMVLWASRPKGGAR